MNHFLQWLEDLHYRSGIPEFLAGLFFLAIIAAIAWLVFQFVIWVFQHPVLLLICVVIAGFLFLIN